MPQAALSEGPHKILHLQRRDMMETRVWLKLKVLAGENSWLEHLY